MIILFILASQISIFLELQKDIENSVSYSDRGELIAQIGSKFIGEPYISNSLDEGEKEVCTFNLDGFDCVTFYETSIALSELIIKQEKFTQESINNEIINLRYKNGKVDGYESRLHYSSQWIIENTKRNKFEDITQGLGGEEFNPIVSFMSENPDKYSRLDGKTELTKKIKVREDLVNKNSLYFIPTKYVEKIESELKSGDIIFFKTNINGLDYAHTGMIYLEDDIPKLLHASSTKKEVIKDVRISEYLKNKKTLVGITILRPY